MMGALLAGVLVLIALGLRWYHELPLPPGIQSYYYLPHMNFDLAVLLGIVLGSVSLILVHKLRKHFKLPDMMWVFGVSPYFVHTVLFTTPAMLAQPLFLAGMYAYLIGLTPLLYGAFFLLSWVGFTHAVIAFGLLFLLKKKPWVALPGLIYMAAQPRFVETGAIISEFGSGGLSSFALLLAIMGAVLLWKYKKKFYWLYVSSILLLVLSVYERSLLVYTNLIICFLAGTALQGIRKAKWDLQEVKRLFVLLLFCGLLFSGLSYATYVGTMQPNKEVYDSLVWLRNHSKPDALVYSLPDNGYWIEKIGERTAFHLPGEKLDENITHSYNLDNTILYFSRNDITHVLITQDMLGKVWDSPEQEFLYLLGSDAYEKVYDNGYATIYEFKGRR